VFTIRSLLPGRGTAAAERRAHSRDNAAASRVARYVSREPEEFRVERVLGLGWRVEGLGCTALA